MSLSKRNCCKGSYQSYQAGTVKKLVEQIPKDRRAVLAEEIFCRAKLVGRKNGSALRLALKHLSGTKADGKGGR